MHLVPVDGLIIAIYGAFVLGIGVVLRRKIVDSADFFLAGRSIPAWVAGLAFLSANLGAQEVIGMAASGAKYGILTSHFYWVGAIPAMVFVGVFMMPFYYGSRARSVPEYLKLRFDEKTRGFNAITFAAMTVFSSGISMYAMGALLTLLLGWNIHVSIVVSAVVVLCYIALGGLTSAIYNEVLQFFLIVFGFAPLVFLGLRDVGGWAGLVARVPDTFTHSWKYLGHADANPMGVEWFGMAMGLGFVLSFGYWCTDFLVVQRAMAADSMNAARRTPLIAAVPKMLFPFLVILPGIIALALTTHPNAGAAPLLTMTADGAYDYNMALPLMLARYYPSGLLGLGLTALMASFMSGMAGNVTAFNTVWTYDIYQSYIAPRKSDAHYLWMGRMATVFGVAISVTTAYVAMRFDNIMDMLQLVFSFVNAPLFATFLLGMFWRRTTGHGAFGGLVRPLRAHARGGGRFAAAKTGGDPHLPVGYGAEFLGRHLGVDHLFRDHRRRQPGDASEGRHGTSRPRLRVDAADFERRPALVPTSRDAGHRRAGDDGCTQPAVLVTEMNLDLRVPLGLLFTLLGSILVIHGLAVGTRVLGFNVNLVWGAVMVVFGGVALYLAGARKTGA